MPKTKEPDFMKELHKIRRKLAKEWDKMTSEEMLKSLHNAGKWLKTQLRSPVLK